MGPVNRTGIQYSETRTTGYKGPLIDTKTESSVGVKSIMFKKQ